ncbi:17058_t:CDS:1, partial [Dentiscutata heterogama]
MKTAYDINGTSNDDNVIKKYKNNNGDKKDAMSRESSSDCKAITDNRV